MAVLFFEGFDLHAQSDTSGINPAGVWDWQGDPGWSHGGGGTTRANHIVDGYQKGSAFVPNRNYDIITVDYAGLHDAQRVHWWGKTTSTGSDKITSSDRGFVQFNIGSDKSQRIGLRSASYGNIYNLAYFSGSGDFQGTVIGSGQIVFDGTWANYELYVDSVSNTVEAYKDGVLVASASGEIPWGDQVGALQIGTPQTPRMRIDHVVVTDGDSLYQASGYHGVAVSYAFGASETDGSIGSLGSRLTVNGTTYYSTERTAPDLHLIGLNGDKYSPQAMNVYHDYWMLNPDGNVPWSGLLEGKIDAFGLVRGDSGGGTMYFANHALTYVRIIDDFPQVRYVPPGCVLEMSGTWDKTDSSQTWGGHLDNYPREMPVYDTTKVGDPEYDPYIETTYGWFSTDPFEDGMPDDLFLEDYIGVLDEGEISFKFSLTAEDRFSGIGLTFAEEFKDTYKDWASLACGDTDCYESYFITGYKLHGESDKKFQSNYVTINYETDANGSAYAQGLWDYSLNGDTGRWGVQQQVYGPTNDTDYKHAFRKLKMRGHGRALQMKVKSECGLPFFINGWAMYVTSNSLA